MKSFVCLSFRIKRAREEAVVWQRSSWIVVFNSLMFFVVCVFLAEKTFSPDTWVAGVAPRADVLALVMRFLCTVVALSVKPGRFFFQQIQTNSPRNIEWLEQKNNWPRKGLSCESRKSERSQFLGCLWILRLPYNVESENTWILILIHLVDGSFIKVILDQRNVCKSCKICTLHAFRGWSMFSFVVVRLHQIVRLWKTLVHRYLFLKSSWFVVSQDEKFSSNRLWETQRWAVNLVDCF